VLAKPLAGAIASAMTGQEPPVSMAEEFVITESPIYVSSAHNEPYQPTPLSPVRKTPDFRARIGLKGIARRTLGILLLLVTVFLWTGSNFLASVSSVQMVLISSC
jgi:hypothetical protein